MSQINNNYQDNGYPDNSYQNNSFNNNNYFQPGPVGNFNGMPPVNSAPVQEEISILKWLGILILCAIPLVNIITICYLLFKSKGNKTKFNFAAAQLIMVIISYVFLFIKKAAVGMILDTIVNLLS